MQEHKIPAGVVLWVAGAKFARAIISLAISSGCVLGSA